MRDRETALEVAGKSGTWNTIQSTTNVELPHVSKEVLISSFASRAMGILLRLTPCFEHRVVPSRAATNSRALLRALLLNLSGLRQRLLSFALFHALFRFENKTTAFVEIDTAGARRTVGMTKKDRSALNT